MVENMKTVGILTFQFANNYGAVLQAYALRKKINSLGGYEAEVINYVPEGYKYPLLSNTEEGYQKMLEKRACFEGFLREKCGICKPMISEVVGNEYDYYCVGSDQVWNMEFPFSGENYFLAHLEDDAVRFSYAASVGMSAETTEKYADIFAKNISKFKAVSLREKVQMEVVEKTSGLLCKTVADPTLLLEPGDYEEIIAKEPLRREPFIFFFWIQHDHELMRGAEFVNTLSRKWCLPVVHSIPDAPPCMFARDGGSMIYEGPGEFLWYIKNAQMVVTNSYHATLFSMQYQTPFYVFPVQSMRSRMDMLVQQYDIGNRVVETYKGYDDVEQEMDFISVCEKIKEQRADALVFLQDALDMKKG